MNKYFANLRPLERRLVVGVGVALLIILNWAFVWPHFADAGNYQNRLDGATRKLKSWHAAVDQIPDLQKQLKKYEGDGLFVPPEDQGISFIRTVQEYSMKGGVVLQTAGRLTSNTNDAFYIRQVQNINVIAPEENLVNFLYELGSDKSMIRVRDLTLQPDPPRQRLAADIQLVASYQKNPTVSAAKETTAKAK